MTVPMMMVVKLVACHSHSLPANCSPPPPLACAQLVLQVPQNCLSGTKFVAVVNNSAATD